VQNPKKVLRKDFLLESVWPDSFVEEGNLTFNVRQLRKALNDDAQSPIYIETIPRRGYRFLQPVEASTTITPDRDERPNDGQTEFVAPVPEKKSKPYVLVVTAAIVVLLGVVAIGGWLFTERLGSRGVPILSAPFSLEKLSKDGRVNHIVVTPDGSAVIYTYRSSGKQGIWLRQLDGSGNVPIIQPTEDFYGGLAISPDGKTIYFVRSGSQNALSIYRMPIFGGVPQKVTEGTQGWISVSADGTKISFVRCPYTDDDYCSLYIADAQDGQNEKKLVANPRPIRIGDNKISPDGKTVAFAYGQSWTGSNEFMLGGADVETGAVRQLTPEKFFNINYISWLPNDEGLLMTALQFPDKPYRIWRVSPNGGLTKLTSDSETYSRLSLDRSGTLLVSTQIQPDFNLMLYRLENPDSPYRVLYNAQTVWFGPDGRLFFSSERSGNYEIWSVNQDGSDEHQLTNDPASDSVPVVSPDNRFVYFTSNRSGSIQVWRMSMDGSNQKQITTTGEGGFPLRVSPDGAWVYYRSGLNNTLRRVEVDTGREELVFERRLGNVMVSADTTRIAFSERRAQESVITIMSIQDRTVVRTYRVAGPSVVSHVAWSGDGKSLAYIVADEKREAGSLWLQPLTDEPPRRIADLSGDEISEFQSFNVSDDGKTFGVIKGTWKHDAVLLRGLK
jgi:Tol biopolymer transport system component